jgi:hypothetical protein
MGISKKALLFPKGSRTCKFFLSPRDDSVYFLKYIVHRFYMTQLCPTRSDYLRDAFREQESAFQKKLREKLRGFLNLSTGKAGMIADLVSESDRERLQLNRQLIWEWRDSRNRDSCPLLPPTFPVQFFIARFGPIAVGHGTEAPCLANLVCDPVHLEIVSESTRKVSPGEFYVMLSLASWESYSELVARLHLKKSERYQHSFFGAIDTKLYGSVPVSVYTTSLSIIANSHAGGLHGKPISGVPDRQEELTPMKDSEAVSERIAWFESELALVEASIVAPATHAASVATLILRKDMFYHNLDPNEKMWRGEQEYVVAREESSVHNFRSLQRLSLAVNSIVLDPKSIRFIQDWFNSRVQAYSETPGEDPGDGPEKGYDRLHYLLSACMRHQEKMADDRGTSEFDEKWTPRRKQAVSRAGGVARDLNTPLCNLSVYDPVNNPVGILLFPTYLPTHLLRLSEWFETHLPELSGTLPDQSFKVHFVHIDSEGEFFQLHTERGGCVIIYTGMNHNTERELVEHVRFQCGVDVKDPWRELTRVTKDICRESTLSRPDVVFGGDRAACPLASHSDTLKDEQELPWMDSDMTGWFWFVGGQPGVDFLCTRSIDKTHEQAIVQSAPMGFKTVVDCAPANMQNRKDSCLCKKFFTENWLRTCEVAHPQLWHGYPQSGATSFKSLSRDKLDWTVLYYAIADLIKAKMLTVRQPRVDIHIVTPMFSFNRR